MRMLMWVGISAVGVMAAVGGLVVGVPAAPFVMEYGCGPTEERLGEALAGDPVLDAGVEEARAEESYQECDDDDLNVVAGKAYRYGGDRESVLVHYRDAARAHGWRYRTSACFTKSIDGSVASLILEGLTDGSLQVEIIAADGATEHWC